MEENIKDWFATRVLNPNLILNDIVAAGFNPENTTLRPAEDYISTKKVQEIFTKNGKFDEESFYNTYNVFAKEYEILNNYGIENYILDHYEKTIHQWDVPFGKIKNPNIQSEFRANPQFTAIGVTGVNEVSEPLLSVDEAAQRSNIWDPVNKMWLDVTPNDLGFIGVFNTPLVLATNEDGSLKINNLGNYYYELAGNSENVGKRHLSAFNVITDDLGDWNWVDIFDSDDIEQNAFKTTLKGIATVAAFTIPGIRDVVTYSTAALSLGRALPSMSKSILSIFDENVEFDKLNTWDNVMQSLHAGKSEYSQSRLFTYENIMDFATSSFMQLSQQRAIASLPQRFKAGKIKKAEEELQQVRGAYLLNANAEMQATFKSNPKLLDDLIKNTNSYRKITNDLEGLSKVSTAISRGYMVVTSAEGVYNMARSYGFDPQTSGFISLLTYGGLGYLFSTDYMRGYLYNTPDYEKMLEIKNYVKSFTQNNLKQLSSAKNAPPEVKKKLFGKLGKKFKNGLDNHILKVASGKYGVGHGMIAEALEETTEELTQDLAFEIGKQWTSLKELYTGKSYDHNYSWSKTDPLKRYATAFVGGAIGGGIFKLSDRYIYDRNNFKKFTEALGDNDKLANEILFLVADNKSDLILKMIDKVDQEMNISKNISAFDGMPTNNYLESQHSVIIGGFKKMIQDFDSFLSSHNLKIEKDRFKDLDVIRNLRADVLVSSNLANSLYNDYFGELQKITKLYGEIQETSTKISTTSDETLQEQHKTHLQDLNREVEDRKDTIRNILTMKDDSYLGSLIMRLNPNLSDALLPSLKDTFANKYFNARYEELDDSLKKSIDRYYTEITSKTSDISYYKAWQIYKEIANDETIKSLLVNHKTTQNNGALSSYSLSSTGQFTRNSDVVKSPQYYFPLLKSLMGSLSGLSDNQKNYLTAKLLNISSLPDYISFEEIIEDDILDLDDNLKAAIRRGSEQLRKLADTYYTRLENIKLEEFDQFKKDFDSEHDIFKYLFNTSKSKEEFLETLEYVEKLVENVDADQLEIMTMEQLQVEDLHFIYDLINKLSEKLGYKELNIQEFIFNQKQRAEQLGKDFVLGDAENTLYNMKDLLKIAQSLMSGAYDQYSANLYSIPIGANNFLNTTAKQYGYDFELVQLGKDEVEIFKMKLAHISADLSDLENKAKANKRAVISEEIRLSVQRDSQCISNLRDFILQFKADSLFKDFNFPEELETWALVDTKNMSQNDLMEIGKQTRNLIFNFEKSFYDWYKNQTDKVSIVKAIKYFCKDDITGDTAILQVDGKDLFNKTDLWHFFLGAAFDHNDEIMHNYKIYVEESTTKCPFDSQEQLITSALKFLFRDRTYASIWFSEFFDGIKDDNLSSTAYIMKMMAAGGVGKSTTIIPAIYHVILHSSLKNKRCVFSANTQDQVNDLKINISKGKISGTPDPEFVTHNNLFNDKTNWEDYRGSIIFVDESTYIPQSKITGDNSISDIAKTYDIDFIFSGDTDQGGVLGNIDQVVAYSSPILSDSKRAFSDIMRYNLRFWSDFRVSQRTHRSFNKITPSLTYWKQDGKTFEGNYFMKDGEILTPEYIEQFLTQHPLPDNGKILIFTDNAVNFESLKSKFGDKIEILSEIESIQGRQWNYVFTDKTFNLDIEEQIKAKLDGKNKQKYDDLYEKEYHKIYNEWYTLFSRPINGIISANPLIFKNIPGLNGKNLQVDNTTCVPSKYPPVQTGLTKEAIEEFVKFKMDVLNSLPIQWEGGQTKPPQAVPPKEGRIPDNTTMVQCTTGFVWKEDRQLGFDNLDQIKNTIIEGITKGEEFAHLLPEELKNGQILVFYQETDKDNFENLGNEERDNKDVAMVHPWLVYSFIHNGERKNIHLGMFHNEKGTELMNLTVTQATKVLNDKSSNKKGKYYQLKSNESIVFSRPSNPIAIQNNEMNSDISLEYRDGTLNIVDPQGIGLYNFINTSMAFYNNIYAWNAVPGMSEIDSLLKTQKTLYKDIFNKLAPLYNLQTSNNTPESVNADVNDILSLVGFNREKSIFRARGVPDIYHKFISFVRLNTLTTASMSEADLANEYIGYIKARNNQLNKVLDVLNGKDSDVDKKIQIKRVLNSEIYSDVSILVFDPEFIENEGDFNKAMGNIHKDKTVTGRPISSYNNALLDQLSIVLERVFALYKAYENTKTPNTWENTPTLEQMNITDRTPAEYVTPSDVASMMEYIQRFIGEMMNSMNTSDLTYFVNYFVSQVHTPEDKSKKINENWVSLLSEESFKEFFKEIFLNVEHRNFWQKFLNKTNTLKNAVRKNDKVDTTSYNFTHFSGQVYTKLLKDNGFNFLDYDGKIYRVDGTLKIPSKVIQRHQIHLYLPDEKFEDLFEEVIDKPIEPEPIDQGESPFIDTGEEVELGDSQVISPSEESLIKDSINTIMENAFNEIIDLDGEEDKQCLQFISDFLNTHISNGIYDGQLISNNDINSFSEDQRRTLRKINNVLKNIC